MYFFFFFSIIFFSYSLSGLEKNNEYLDAYLKNEAPVQSSGETKKTPVIENRVQMIYRLPDLKRTNLVSDRESNLLNTGLKNTSADAKNANSVNTTAPSNDNKVHEQQKSSPPAFQKSVNENLRKQEQVKNKKQNKSRSALKNNQKNLPKKNALHPEEKKGAIKFEKKTKAVEKQVLSTSQKISAENQIMADETKINEGEGQLGLSEYLVNSDNNQVKNSNTFIAEKTQGFQNEQQLAEILPVFHDKNNDVKSQDLMNRQPLNSEKKQPFYFKPFFIFSTLIIITFFAYFIIYRLTRRNEASHLNDYDREKANRFYRTFLMRNNDSANENEEEIVQFKINIDPNKSDAEFPTEEKISTKIDKLRTVSKQYSGR